MSNKTKNETVSSQDSRNLLKIEFDQPSKRNKDETRSKYLHQESFLYFFVIDAQEKLKHSGLRFGSGMAPHVEILNQTEAKLPDEKKLYLERVATLQGSQIDVSKRENYKVIGKAFCLMLPSIEGRQFCIKICQLQTLAPHIDRFLKIVLDEEYSTYTEHEFTVFD